MLGFLPRPGEDELLYSVVARYGALAGQDVASQVMGDVFGAQIGVVATDLPRHIPSMLGRLPRGFDLSADQVIARHTLYPYIVRFAPPTMTAGVRAYMLDKVVNRPARLGVTSGLFPQRQHLMFCQQCVRKDQLTLGMAAWRRVHQLPGVFLCPEHETKLLESTVLREARRGKGAIVALTEEVARNARQVSLPRGSREPLLGFAQGSRVLLQYPFEPWAPGDFQKRLRVLLHRYRWAKAPSLIHSSAFVGDVLGHPAVRYLISAMGIEWTPPQAGHALNRLIYDLQVTKHPLLVLMVLAVAGSSIEKFLDRSIEVSDPVQAKLQKKAIPELRHDLPCGNPACGRFKEPLRRVFTASNVSPDPMRAVCLACSFHYVKDARRPGAVCVMETGGMWDDLLCKTMADPKTSVRVASQVLGVGPTTIQRHARRLGLWRSEWKDRPKLQLRSKTRTLRLVQHHRKGWIKFMARGIRLAEKSMPRTVRNAARYLRRHDEEWWEMHQSEPALLGSLRHAT